MPDTIRGAEAVGHAVTLCLLALWMLIPAAPAGELLAQPQSRFGFRGTVEGAAFDAVFNRFAVHPALDSRHIPNGFDVEIDLNAVDSGDAERDAEMRAPGWFDVARYPIARFTATRVAGDTKGGYLAYGDLTLKGITRPIAVPFDWQHDGERVRMRGRTELDRRWFAVGPDDDSSVAASVVVVFDLQWLAR